MDSEAKNTSIHACMQLKYALKTKVVFVEQGLKHTLFMLLFSGS